MLKTRQIFLVFIPALLLGALGIFIQFIQYRPLNPEPPAMDQTLSQAPTLVPLLPSDPIIGNKKAPITLIAFEDFGCEGCKSQTDMLDKLLAKYPDKVKIIWKGLPVTTFPQDTTRAHIYGYCAYQQNKFTEYQKLAFANSDNLSETVLGIIKEQLKLDEARFAECIASEEPRVYIDQTKQIALSLYIQAVPTFFLNNKQIQAPQFLEGWETLLNL